MMDAQPDSNSSKDRDSLGDESPMNPTPKAIVAGKRSRLTSAVLIGFLLLVVAVAALPGYLQLQWPWMSPPPVITLRQLQELRQTGIEIPDWETVNQQEIFIGGHKWSVQSIEKDNQTAVVLLLPQNGPLDQPQVAWVDINGFQQQLSRQWRTDSRRRKSLSLEATPDHPTAQVTARYFRGWNPSQTYAILQWYAWPGGGHPAPSQWFWVDRAAQTRRDRAPWVAVCVLIPIEPLGDIEQTWPMAESLGESIQSTLMAGPLKFRHPSTGNR